MTGVITTNHVVSFKSVVSRKENMVGVREYSKRLAICHECPEMANKLTGRYCRLCGCYLKAKAAREGDSCPIGKW